MSNIAILIERRFHTVLVPTSSTFRSHCMVLKGLKTKSENPHRIQNEGKSSDEMFTEYWRKVKMKKYVFPLQIVIISFVMTQRLNSVPSSMHGLPLYTLIVTSLVKEQYDEKDNVHLDLPGPRKLSMCSLLLTNRLYKKKSLQIFLYLPWYTFTGVSRPSDVVALPV